MDEINKPDTLISSKKSKLEDEDISILEEAENALIKVMYASFYDNKYIFNKNTNKKYKVVIKSNKNIIYEGIYKIKKDKLKINSIIDKENYEKKIVELIKNNFNIIKQNKQEYKIKDKNITENIYKIFKKLKTDNKEIEYNEIKEKY